MWTLVMNTILMVSVVLGIPAVLAVLWGLLRRHRGKADQGPFQRAIASASKTVLLAFGAIFVLGGVTIPLVISKSPPVRDEALIRIAPQFAHPKFNLVFTSTFGANADFGVEYKQNPDRVCLTLSKPREGESVYGGWMIIFWTEFLYKFFKDLGYPEAGRSLADYNILSFQVKGEKGGEKLDVAIKDKTKGRREERKYPPIELPKDSTDWQTFELDLKKEFKGVDFSKIETISFSMNQEQSVCIKDIKLR